MEPDLHLVKRMTTGDDVAAEELFRRHSSSVYAMVYAILQDPEAADAVVTATFRYAHRVSGQFHQARGTVFSWLSTIARGQATSFETARQSITWRHPFRAPD